MTQRQHHLHTDEVQRLISCYFEGETTEQEEGRLRAFLCSTDDPAYDDVRATMSYLAVGRRLHRSPSRRLWRPMAAAASVVLVCMLGLAGWRYYQQQNLCVATVAGHEVPREQATELMFSQMQEMLNPTNEPEP
ncbi:MAG: hypothetical protein IJ253_05205 [Bacteroidaceae bacterium]|nr:hypothetical protein [Bacteroidaceae bacterium]